MKYGFGSLQDRHKHDGSEQLDRIRGVWMNKDMMDLVLLPRDFKGTAADVLGYTDSGVPIIYCT